jgi:hypothetical protein
LPEGKDDQTKTTAPNRRARLMLVLIGTVLILWQIAATEYRVAQLRADGFGDVVISSTRNHAYFPIIGAVLGSLLFIGLFTVLKRLFRKNEY